MGGLALGIGLTTAPADAAALDALHHQVWDIVANRIARLVEGFAASEEIAANYLYFEESDGFDDGSWFADKAERVPPFDHHGQPAVRLHLFSCDGGKTTFVGYLEKLPEDVLQHYRIGGGCAVGGRADTNLRAGAGAGREAWRRGRYRRRQTQ